MISMLPRISLIVVGGASLSTTLLSGPISLLTFHKVEAASSSGSEKPASHAPHGKKLIKASQLPIYDDPTEGDRYEVVEKEPSAYFQAVSDARKWIWTYTDSIQGTTKQVADAYKLTKKTAQDGLQYIQKDSGALPRAIVISVAGLGGIVAGYRGGFFRKTTYATISMTAAAAVCYPKQASVISKKGWIAARERTIKVYHDITADKPSGDAKQQSVSHKHDHSIATAATATSAATSANKPSTTASKTETKEKDKNKNQTSAEKVSEQDILPERTGRPFFRSGSPPVGRGGSPPPGREGAPPKGSDPVSKDYGMSNPEDKDMYSTRGAK